MCKLALLRAGQALNSRNVSKATDSLPEGARSLSMFSQRRGALKQASLLVTALDMHFLQNSPRTAFSHVVLWQMVLLLGAARKSQAEVYKAARGLYGGRASSGISTAASGAMSTVGAVWSFVSAEAATDGSLAPEDAAPLPPPPKLDISVSLSVLSEGMHLILKAPCWLLYRGASVHVWSLQLPWYWSLQSIMMPLICGVPTSAVCAAGAAVMLYHDKDLRGKHPGERLSEMGSNHAQAWWQALHADHSVLQVCDPASSLLVASMTCVLGRICQKIVVICRSSEAQSFYHNLCAASHFPGTPAGRGSRPGWRSLAQEVSLPARL